MISTSKFVNKQFNSPINLYSPQSIQEALDRQTQVLSNGAIGIDFNQLTKPKNLKNSAVLRMLEEEERIKAERAGLKRVAWPPPPEGEYYVNCTEQCPIESKDKIGISKIENRVPSMQTRGVDEYILHESLSPTIKEKQTRQQYQQTSEVQQPSQFQTQHLPSIHETPAIALMPTASLQTKTVLPALTTSTNPPRSKIQDAYEYDEPRFQSQQNPLSSIRGTWNDKPQQILSITQEQLPQHYYQQQNTKTHFEPPPSVITLRPETPISQIPSPVYQAQPAAINPNSNNMRGDLKWPPASVKEQAKAENRARIEVAKSPVCRPRRANKDYSSFFAQHSGTNNYPVYRAPPGTQYFTPAYQQ